MEPDLNREWKLFSTAFCRPSKVGSDVNRARVFASRFSVRVPLDKCGINVIDAAVLTPEPSG